MKCNNCGMDNPTDSEFCQYCGKKIETTKSEAQKAIDPESFFLNDAPKSKYRSKSVTICAIIALIVVLAGLNVYQYINGQGRASNSANLITALEQKNGEITSLEESVEKKEKEIQAKENRIDELNEKISELEKNMSDSEEKVEFYDDLWFTFSDQESYGYASNNFRVNDGIVVLKRGGNKKTITLTANFSDYVEIDSDINGISADLEWNEDEWSGSTTTLSIIPSRIINGVTTITFSNSINNKSFKVLVIVL